MGDMEFTCKTPIEELRKHSLNHYDKASSKLHEWRSDIPKAINFYYDYQQMTFWQRIKLAVKYLIAHRDTR